MPSSIPRRSGNRYRGVGSLIGLVGRGVVGLAGVVGQAGRRIGRAVSHYSDA